MRTLNNEIIITRGETFTMDKRFVNKDGSPYIISNQLFEPYWLLVVSSSEFEQRQQYIKEYYLPLKDYPRFLSTQPKNFNEIFKDKNSFEDVSVALDGTYGKILAVVTVGNDLYEIQSDDYVYYLDVDGVRKYKYATISDDGKVFWHDYECRLTKLFTSDDTLELTSQNYTYSISLIDEMDGQTFCKPILLPTKLTVKNRLQGG